MFAPKGDTNLLQQSIIRLIDLSKEYFIALTIIFFALISYWLFKSSEKYDFNGKTCVITGGSSGLGKAIAAHLLGKGANVFIIARSQKMLDNAVDELKSFKKSSKQKLDSVSADVTSYDSIRSAVQKIETIQGHIDAIFTCAGSSKPGFFLNQDSSDFKNGMELNYLGTLYSVKAAAESMVKKGVKNGKIVMISSTLGLMGMVGYSQYSPTKFALRGLAECLRQELIPYGIKVSIYFVSTIQSPGYEKENLTKPKITKMIEDGDPSDPSPEARAKSLIKGVEKNQFFITSDIITDLFRVLGSGISPWNSVFDPILNFIGQLVVPFWRSYSDYLVATEHKKNK